MKTYGPGKQVTSLMEFNYVLNNNILLFIKNWNKTAHPIILANMQYRTVKGFIEHGQVFIAKKI